jgi:uncharacterized protein YndB with AHSA1/START domain
MQEQPSDWSSFRKRIVVLKPMPAVYAAWAKPGQLTEWFLEKAVYTVKDKSARDPQSLVQKGDAFTWKWHNWDFEEKGEVLEANGTDAISFTFGPGGNVHVRLKHVSGGTEVTLTQDQIPTDDKSKKDIFVGCATGWTFWMTNLKAWLEHDITLHATGLKQSETADLVNS